MGSGQAGVGYWGFSIELPQLHEMGSLNEAVGTVLGPDWYRVIVYRRNTLCFFGDMCPDMSNIIMRNIPGYVEPKESACLCKNHRCFPSECMKYSMDKGKCEEKKKNWTNTVNV